jgi:hypothetical protein
MDSITHALYRAVTADNAHQRRVEDTDRETGDQRPNHAGLQPLAQRPDVHNAYQGAAGTDFHIELERGDETICLYMEFVAAGFTPPAGLIDGGTVLLSPGHIELYVATDNGQNNWCAQLSVLPSQVQRPGDHQPRKAGWTEQLV